MTLTQCENSAFRFSPDALRERERVPYFREETVAGHGHDLMALAVGRARQPCAFELLTDPARAGTRIGDIAAAVGYAEHATFDRASRRRFGHTPSDVRDGR